jgi:hypothetical protein
MYARPPAGIFVDSMLRKSEGLKRAWFALVCGLLLFAQHVGLSHAIWHAAHALPGHEQQVDRADGGSPVPSELSRLCDLDAVFAQVLAGGPLASHAFSAEKPSTDTTTSESYPFVSFQKPSPRSRGPPALS